MTIVDTFREEPLRVLDRLVDDELSPSDRRALLAALDDEPGAWRACALAFVEHQSWQQQLPAAALELSAPAVRQAGTSVSGMSARGTSRRSWWGMCLAVAAALLLSFGLGTQFSPPSASVEIAAQPATSEPTTTPAIETEPRIPRPSEVAPQQVAETAEELPWTTLTLASTDPAHPDKQIQVRVLSDSQTENATETSPDNWTDESAVPSELLAQLEAAGWQVERKQRLLPVDLTDGRRMVVPVEELDLSFPQWIRY